MSSRLPSLLVYRYLWWSVTILCISVVLVVTSFSFPILLIYAVSRLPSPAPTFFFCFLMSLVKDWWECKLVQPLWKTVWRFLKRLKIVIVWSWNPTSGHISGKNCNLKRYMHASVHCNTFTIAKTWKDPKHLST